MVAKVSWQQALAWRMERQTCWISAVVVAGGVVCGTWALDGDRVRIGWFSEAGRLPRTALNAEVARLSSILDRDLGAAISRVSTRGRRQGVVSRSSVLVEERRDGGREGRGDVDVVMGHAGQDGEAVPGHPGAIPAGIALPAAK